MTDLDVRSLERRYHQGGVDDHVAYLRARIRRGDLSEDRVRAAAFLGHVAAAAAVDCTERLREPSQMQHRLRRGVHAVFAAIEEWAGDLEPPPYTRDLRERVAGLRTLGLPAAQELIQIVLRLVAHDWGTLSDCHDQATRLRVRDDPGDLDSAFEAAADVVAAAAAALDAATLWSGIRAGLIAWGLGEPFEVQRRARTNASTAEDDRDEEPPIVRLANLTIEDAYVRGAQRIVIGCLDLQGDEAIVVRYLDLPASEGPDVRMQLPPRSGPQLILRYQYMAGLDLLSHEGQRGTIEYGRWGWKGLEAKLELTVEPGGQQCELRFQYPTA